MDVKYIQTYYSGENIVLGERNTKFTLLILYILIFTDKESGEWGVGAEDGMKEV